MTRIKDGDFVQLLGSEVTLKDYKRDQRTVPPGTLAMVERQAHGILRLVISDPNPADGLHDAAVVGSSRVKPAEHDDLSGRGYPHTSYGRDMDCRLCHELVERGVEVE